MIHYIPTTTPSSSSSTSSSTTTTTSTTASSRTLSYLRDKAEMPPKDKAFDGTWSKTFGSWVYLEKAKNGIGNEKVGEEAADVHHHQACHGTNNTDEQE
eukprot:scaffold585532_cov79-Attheya_sp.AAC.1